MNTCHTFMSRFTLVVCSITSAETIFVFGEEIHPVTQPVIRNGVVVVEDGTIQAVGPASMVDGREADRVIQASVVVPGFVDARATVGLTGQFNHEHDQDHLDTSEAMQPELRAIDAYNWKERLVEWVRGFGVTTVHTGHSPGELISGQTCIVKTAGRGLQDDLVQTCWGVSATLGEGAQRSGSSPGNRSKAVAMLRQAMIAAEERLKNRSERGEGNLFRNLREEMLEDIASGERPLIVHADRAFDISAALRLKEEFGLDVVLESAAEAHGMIDAIKAANVPIFLHPTMARGSGERLNVSFTTAAKLREAGVPVAFSTGYEAYVPKVRVLVFEAAMAIPYGLSREDALAMITIEPAKILGIQDRVGSIEPGKDADLAFFDGDPFEWVTHCEGVMIDGQSFEQKPR
ncbi:MAG: amidohydrolase family protein [Planctomycetota bacterium]|nr:amidohydrolase family protein [Planctomycetota bacterium]MEC8386154.1 amidohydrolase family protein [Planctomycetota bacterium]MEC8770488.1 amidohydrolase family protein [Planctomycetota bacterium]